MLGSTSGKFILSFNERPVVREVFAGFELEVVSVTYTANANSVKAALDLPISSSVRSDRPDGAKPRRREGSKTAGSNGLCLGDDGTAVQEKGGARRRPLKS